MMISQSSQQTISRTLIVFVLAVWFAIVVVAAQAGLFVSPPSLPPVGIATSLLVPLLLFLGAWYASRRVQHFVSSIKLRTIAWIQTSRVIGGAFLIYYFLGALPGVFALPAGIGDILVGLTAPLIVLLLGSSIRSRFSIIVGWNIFGLLDLVVAISLGILTSPSPLGLLAGTISTEPVAHLPLSLIPTFLVPFYIILHLITFARLNQVRQGLSA